VLAFLAICLSIFIFVRRRRLRRRREALLEAALHHPAGAAGPANFPGGGGGPEEEEVLHHHAWHIRTVGLDAAAIESIALTRYRAGGALGASDDCTVCLGEFQDGELLRLLPKCAHAFHVQCIDTWLRAHVSCPLCRANVLMDTAAAAATAEQPGPTPPGAGDDAEQEQDAGNTGALELEQPGQNANGQPDISSWEQPHQRPGPRGSNFRRVASMDSPLLPIASAVEAHDPEHEMAGGEKRGAGGAVCCEVSPGFDHPNRAAMKRSLSAGSRWTLLPRPCRQRGSLLPL
jgi:hypothetical protein